MRDSNNKSLQRRRGVDVSINKVKVKVRRVFNDQH